MHHQDRAVLAVELPLVLEDNVLTSRDASGSEGLVVKRETELETEDLPSGVDTQPPYLVRMDLIGINGGSLNGRILSSNPDDVNVGINISLNHQLPRLFVDGAKITSLFVWDGSTR